MAFGRSANQSNIVAVFMLQQRTSMSLCNVHPRVGPVAACLAEAEDIASYVNCAPTAVCVAVEGQLAPSQFAISVQPLLHGGARRRHDRNRVAEDLAGRKLEAFMGRRRIAEADDIWKGVVATGIANAPPGAPDYLVCKITSIGFPRQTFGHVISLNS
jgi:hypothetical protein